MKKEIGGWELFWDVMRSITNLLWTLGTIICGINWAIRDQKVWMVSFIVCALFMVESDVYVHLASQKYKEDA